ncbi:hypothetical protein MTAT_04420 [Moorella thermoacetica]|uniref:Uncharacterized protein n=1 Tax=Neomoorella thermoacetica TaxID=1525 RepID=A0AAC9HJ12_NEOTH|nr:hypothetical protein [Moorella thermoacetica]AOQ24759.1 hypothetical protein Maut_02331 [Moorella thermoacetica]TYL15703.1 hypothetical protein MTAT_04420 [Moorella thermoacetica]
MAQTIEIPRKTEQVSDTIQTEFRFNPEAQQYILGTFPLTAEEELTAIADLINGEADWTKMTLRNKMRWIADEIVIQTLLKYAIKEVGVTDEESILTSVDYDGPDIIVTVGQFVEQVGKKQVAGAKAKVVDLNAYRRARS